MFNNCQLKCDSVEKTRSYRLFNITFTALSIGPCGRLPQITWSASFISAHCFRLCFKLPPTLHPTRDSPLGLDPANLEATGPFWWNLDSWSAAIFGRGPNMLRAQYLENGLRYRLGSNGPPIGNGLLRFEWSRDWWRHVTQKGQGHDPNIFHHHHVACPCRSVAVSTISRHSSRS